MTRLVFTTKTGALLLRWSKIANFQKLLLTYEIFRINKFTRSRWSDHTKFSFQSYYRSNKIQFELKVLFYFKDQQNSINKDQKKISKLEPNETNIPDRISLNFQSQPAAVCEKQRENFDGKKKVTKPR